MNLDKFKGISYQRYIAADFVVGDFNVNKRIALFIEEIGDAAVVCRRLLDLYGDIDAVAFCCEAEIKLPISQIAAFCPNAIFIEGRKLIDNKKFDFYDLTEIMARLRAPDGCEWDKAQSHESIRINLIEEAYELVEAIDCKNRDMLIEECGDVLMQAVFHTEIAKFENEFGFSEMLTVLCRKLIDRHTHIFGGNHADNPDEALVFWNEAKKKEKKYLSTSDAMNRIPKNLPALLYSEKLQKLAKKVGFDWDSPEGAAKKIEEEIKEVYGASLSDRHEECGDLLFAAVNFVRLFKIEPECALHDANGKFFRRFESIEKKAETQHKQLCDMTLEEMDILWEEVKTEERR